MGTKQFIKKSFSSGWNVSAWVGVKQIKSNSLMIKDLTRAAFNPQKTEKNAPKSETFEQAMRRLRLTEADIQKRIKDSTQIIFFCSLFSIPMLAYTIYIFMAHFYLSGFVCLMLTFLLFAHIFRAHFNRFQMQQRRLGCSFRSWFAHTFRINLQRKK